MKTTRIKLTPDEGAKLMRPVEGQGGWQDFARKLQGQVSGDEIEVTSEDLERALQYTKGQGGWQDRLAPIARAAERLSASQ